MSDSTEWAHFSAYRGLIADAIAKERARLLKVIKDNGHPIWEVGHFQRDLISLINDEYSYETECKICRDCNDHWHHKSRICENCGGKVE